MGLRLHPIPNLSEKISDSPTFSSISASPPRLSQFKSEVVPNFIKMSRRLSQFCLEEFQTDSVFYLRKSHAVPVLFECRDILVFSTHVSNCPSFIFMDPVPVYLDGSQFHSCKFWTFHSLIKLNPCPFPQRYVLEFLTIHFPSRVISDFPHLSEWVPGFSSFILSKTVKVISKFSLSSQTVSVSPGWSLSHSFWTSPRWPLLNFDFDQKLTKFDFNWFWSQINKIRLWWKIKKHLFCLKIDKIWFFSVWFWWKIDKIQFW